MKVQKRNGSIENFDFEKIVKAIHSAANSVGYNNLCCKSTIKELKTTLTESYLRKDIVNVEEIQDVVEATLMDLAPYKVAKAYILYREKHNQLREWTTKKKEFINKYKESSNTANATVDDNSNVSGKNIGILNSEIHKEDNIQISRRMIEDKLRELYPDFDAKQYSRDLNNHIIYKHDESGFSGAIAPYCCSISMYPFLLKGIKDIGGLSAAPKNLDSFCGMYVNLIFAASAQFAGAVATSEFLLYFSWFAEKEWGKNYHEKADVQLNTAHSLRYKSIRTQIHQYFQQVIYSVNQPAAARGLQSVFLNFSLFDKPFFDGMFGNFAFPDGSKINWESFNWLQKEFLHWFNQERLKCILTFPVVSATLLYKDGEFKDKEFFEFLCKEYAQGNSFFLYISDTVDSLSSCCFTKDTKVLWKSSTLGVNITSLEELYNMKWDDNKKNLRIFHNGSWVKGKPIKTTPTERMFKIVTHNNKELLVTSNHIHPTLDGDKTTDQLTTSDYLLFNTVALQAVPEGNEHLTYEQGFVIGSFLGDGSFGSEVKGEIYDINFSQNVDKYEKCMYMVNLANKQLGGTSEVRVSEIYNNVYPLRISSRNLVEFIIKWTNWKRGIYADDKELNLNCLTQSYEFRKGILDGWYNTDGGNSNRCYTTSVKLKDCMEALITSLGLQSIINISDRTDEKVIIRGEEYNRNFPLWCIRWYEPANHRTNKDVGKTWVKKNNSIYFKIKSIEEIEYSDSVYCIECKNEDEPYFTLPSGIITHNCRLKNKIQTREFNFTNGNIGIMTGSKSVISLNMNRLVQDWSRLITPEASVYDSKYGFKSYLIDILDRVYKYQTAYNELLWDMYNSDLLPVYKAGFIDLNKQYLTIGIIGFTAAAEFLGFDISENSNYSRFCEFVFSTIKEQNELHKTKKTTWNTELVPAESAGIKLYNADKKDGYWTPDDINLYTSYVFRPYDESLSVLDKIKMHGNSYIGDYLDGGSSCHINLDTHLSEEQYKKILTFAAENGCSYLTFNVPNSECDDCGFITKVPITECPKCHSTKITLYERIIG